MGPLALVVAITLGVSAFCSLLEAVLYSTRIPVLEAARGKRGQRNAAERFLSLKRDVATPTAAILILNTVANTAGATVAGMYAAKTLGTGMVPIFSGALTLSILFLSELLPKTVGASRWEVLWPFVARPLGGLVLLLRPLVWMTRAFTRLFSPAKGGVPITEEEIRASMRLGARAGELTRSELKMLEAVFRFEDTLVSQVMVPRSDIVLVDVEDGMDAFRETLRTTTFSRYPLCEGSLDHVVGALHIKDLGRHAPDSIDALRALGRDVLRVPDSLTIARVLNLMQDTRRHLAMVVDEFGTVSGLITLTDILEEIVGRTADELEADAGEEFAQEEAGTVIKGSVSLEAVRRTLGWELYDKAAVTLSGYVVSHLERLPHEGDEVAVEEGVLVVRATDGNRALLVEARPYPKLDSDGQTEPEGEEDDGARDSIESHA